MHDFVTRWGDILRRVSAIPFVFLGVGVYRAWLATFFRYGAFPTVDSADYAIFETFIGIVSLVLAFGARRWAPLWSSRKMCMTTILLMFGGSLLCVFACFLGMPEIFKYIALAAAGGGLGILILMWAEFYGSLNPMRVALYHASAIGFGELLKLLFAGLSVSYVAFFSLALPFVSVGCVRGAMRRLPPVDLPTKAQQSMKRIFPWKPILLMTVCTFATGFGTFAIQPLLPGNIVGSVSVCLLVFFGVLSSSKWFNFNTIYQLAFPLLTVGFLLIAPSLSMDPEIVAMCYDAGYTMLSMFIMIVLSNITYRFGISAVWISGLERGFRYLIETLGWLLYAYTSMPASALSIPAIHTVITAVLVIAFVIIFFTEKGISSRWGINPQTVGTVETGDIDFSNTIQQIRVADLSKAHALSPREEEVLQLLASGHSIAQIEDELYVAHGTVKAHINHIYRKLGVHSREELDDLLGGITADVLSDPE